METQLDAIKVAPEVYRAMLALESVVKSSGLEPGQAPRVADQRL
jgi:hypothetical protein